MPGTLQIRPLSAKLTRDTELFGTMDPYCKFQLGKQNVSGQVCKNGGKHPIWDETLVLKRNNEETCHLQLKEYDWLLPDGIIGECDINLNEIENKQRVLKWYQLMYTGKPVGQILIEMNYDGEKKNINPAPVVQKPVPMVQAPVQHKPEPQVQGFIPSNNVQHMQPVQHEVYNQHVNVPHNTQIDNNQYTNYDNNYSHQQNIAYNNIQHDMFAPSAYENLNNYNQDGHKYPTLECPYNHDNYNGNYQASNQVHEVVDFRTQQVATNNNVNRQKYPGVTNVPLIVPNQHSQDDEAKGWDPIRVIRGAMGTR